MILKASIVCAPFPMSLDVMENLHRKMDLVNQCESHDVGVFPEAALLGSSDNITFLTGIDEQQVTQVQIGHSRKSAEP